MRGRKLRWGLRRLCYGAYYAAIDYNHRHELYAPRKRVGDASFRSYELLLRHGDDVLLRRLLRNLSPGEVVVDAGANTGVYTLAVAAADPTARVVAVEPDPHVCEQLRTNVRRNGFESRVSVHEFGLGDDDGARRFYRSTYDELGSFRESNAAAWEAAVSEVVDVPVRSLDDLVAANEVPPPAHLKIDVEGFGYEVLDGARRTLESHRPVVYLEPHPTGPNPRRGDDIAALFEAVDYHLRVRPDAWLATPRPP